MKQPVWMRTLDVGDVIASGSGTWRIVRYVWRRKNGDLGGVALAIRHCSWTRRCYTVINSQDMRSRGFRRVRVRRRRLTSDVDRLIETAIHQASNVRPFALTCCDVEGIA